MWQCNWPLNDTESDFQKFSDNSSKVFCRFMIATVQAIRNITFMNSREFV